MRKYFCFLLFLIVFINCSSSKTPDAAVRKFYQAVKKNDFKAMAEVATPETIQIIGVFGSIGEKLNYSDSKIKNIGINEVSARSQSLIVTFENGEQSIVDTIIHDGKWKVSLLDGLQQKKIKKSENIEIIPATDIEPETILVSEIYKEVESNPLRAKQMFNGKRLRVEGYIFDFEYHMGGGCSITLSGNKDGGSGRIIIDFKNSNSDSLIKNLARLEKGQNIIIDGIFDDNYGIPFLKNSIIYRIINPVYSSRTVLEEGVPHSVELLAKQTWDNTIWTYLQYNNKKMILYGYIDKIKDDDGIIILTLKEKSDGYIRSDDKLDIRLARSENSKILNFNIGQLIKIEGTCGYRGIIRIITLLNCIIIDE